MKRRRTLVCVMVVALGTPVGCATNKPEMAWVRTDGRRIGDDADLLKQGHTDIAVCNANLDAGVVDQGGRDCMAKKGYALVRKDQAEQARAGYAASAPQRATTPSPADRKTWSTAENTWLPRVHRGNRLTPKLDPRNSVAFHGCLRSKQPTLPGDVIKGL
jgi:hypothetical protein